MCMSNAVKIYNTPSSLIIIFFKEFDLCSPRDEQLIHYVAFHTIISSNFDRVRS
jgi:hypothetical protein